MGRETLQHMDRPRMYPPLLDQLGIRKEQVERAGPVWAKFQELAAIPRPTGGEDAAANWVKKWAKEGKRNYEVKEDEFGNVFVKVSGKPRTEGMPYLIFHGHLDMVDMPTAAKDPEDISPGKYGVEPKVETRRNEEGNEVQVVIGANNGKRTSLGADNGIGVAAMMAVAEYLEEHPEIEHDEFGLLFTRHEEDRLLGAHNLNIEEVFQPNTILINGDNETKGKVYLGSAGGGYTTAKVHVSREVMSFDAEAFTLALAGHHGGHSGEDIKSVKTNANVSLGTILAQAEAAGIDIRLAAVDGGQRMNAIPSKANAVIVLKDPSQKEALESLLERAQKELQGPNESDFRVSLSPVSPDAKPVTMLTKPATEKVRRLLTDLPHGVKSTETLGNIAGNTRTSTNFATIQLTDNFVDEWVDLGFMTRSSSMEELEALRTTIASEIQKIDKEFPDTPGHEAQITQSEAFPSWEPGHDDAARSLLQYASQQTFGETLGEDTTHGGLEIGEFLRLFNEHFPNQPRQVQFVSFGPTIINPHSEHEEVEVETVEWFFKMLLAIPQLLPEWYASQQGSRR